MLLEIIQRPRAALGILVFCAVQRHRNLRRKPYRLFRRWGYHRLLIELVLFLPGLVVFVRRLHDIDRTGWWALLPLVPTIGGPMMLGLYPAGVSAGSWFWPLIHWIVVLGWLVVWVVLLIWTCMRGTLGMNRYGPDPLAGEARAQA